MASLIVKVVSEGGEERVECIVRYCSEKLLTPGLSAPEVCSLYFQACRDSDLDLWLATIHLEARQGPTQRKPGPFQTFNWDLGRARVEKYAVEYQLVKELHRYWEEADPLVVLKFTPVYGKVPGYTKGAPLGNPIEMTLKKQGGDLGEWRVLHGCF